VRWWQKSRYRCSGAVCLGVRPAAQVMPAIGITPGRSITLISIIWGLAPPPPPLHTHTHTHKTVNVMWNRNNEDSDKSMDTGSPSHHTLPFQTHLINSYGTFWKTQFTLTMQKELKKYKTMKQEWRVEEVQLQLYEIWQMVHDTRRTSWKCFCMTVTHKNVHLWHWKFHCQLWVVPAGTHVTTHYSNTPYGITVVLI
jgi:hypothetical protein